MKPILPSHWSVLVNDKAVCMSSDGVNRVFASNKSHCVVVAAFGVSSLPPPIISVCVWVWDSASSLCSRYIIDAARVLFLVLPTWSGSLRTSVGLIPCVGGDTSPGETFGEGEEPWNSGRGLTTARRKAFSFDQTDQLPVPGCRSAPRWFPDDSTGSALLWLTGSPWLDLIGLRLRLSSHMRLTV